MGLQKATNPGVKGGQGDREARVSIIIPYYNLSSERAHFLVEAVKSAKQQTHSNIEVIVVDDGSPIPAATALGELKEVVVLRTENRGVSAARNLGFQRSSGEYLIFLDSDDRLLPRAIETHLLALRGHRQAGMSFGATRTINAIGIQIRPAHVCRPRSNYFLMLLEGNPIGSPGAAMMERVAYSAVGGFDDSLSMGEDYDLYLRIARRFPLVRHPACVLEYREHSANTSLAQERMLTSTMAILDRIEPSLTVAERRRLPHARRRWRHLFRRRSTLAYRLKSLYFSFRAMKGISPLTYFGQQR